MFEVRYMSAYDLRKVAAIEKAVFPEPLTDVRLARMNRNGEAIFLVAEHPDVTRGLAGYLSYVAHPRHIEVTRIAVHPKCRRQGVATALVETLFGSLPVIERNRLTMNVSEKNTAAHLWLKACGFQAIRVERGKDEDIYRFVRRLPVESPLVVA